MDELKNICPNCSQKFSYKKSFKKHVLLCTKKELEKSLGGAKKKSSKSNTEQSKFNCDECDRTFNAKQNLKAHKQRYHSNFPITFPCGFCTKSFESGYDLDQHRLNDHQRKSDFYERETAFRKTCQVHRLDIPRNVSTVNSFIKYSSQKLVDFINDKKNELDAFKYTITLGVEYEKDAKNDLESNPERMLMNFRSKMQTCFKFDEVESNIAKALIDIETNSNEFTSNGSSWVMDKILYADIEIGKCFLLSGSCTVHKIIDSYRATSVLEIKNDKSIETFKDDSVDDGMCFFYAIATYFTKSADMSVLSNFIKNNININIPTPVKVSDVNKFEKANEHLDMSINVVYKSHKNDIFPVYASNRESENVINLLLFHTKASDLSFQTNLAKLHENNDSEIELDIKHYAVIEDLSKEIKRNDYFQRKKQLKKSLVEKEEKLKELLIKYSQICKINDEHQIKLDFNPEYKIEDNFNYGWAANSLRFLQPDLTDFRWKEKELKKMIESFSLEIQNLKDQENEKNLYRKDHLCYNCFSSFSIKESLDSHKKWCFKSEPELYILPVDGEKDEFLQKRKHVWSRISFYFDFEALQVKPEHACSCRPEFVRKAENSSSKQASLCPHQTFVEYNQVPMGYSIIVIKDHDTVLDVVDYVGPDADLNFMNDLLDLEEKYVEYLKINVPIQMTDEDKNAFEQTVNCYICNIKFDSTEVKCADHDHLSGSYLGAACNKCNLNRRQSDQQINCFCHNLISYDSHFIIQAIPKVMDRIYKLKAIPLNTQKFKQITINRLCLKDSLSFLQGSLEKLVKP